MKKNLNEENISNAQDFENADFSIEERNYSKFAFKRLQNLRVDGVAFGVKIPTLSHDLKKPEKKRKGFYIFGIVAIIALALAIFLSVKLSVSLLSVFIDTTNEINSVTNDKVIGLLTFGFSTLFTGLFSAVFYILAAVFVVVLITFISFLILLTRSFFGLSDCSIQEMAFGHEVKNIISKLITLIVLSGIFVGFFIWGFVSGGDATFQLIIMFITMLAVLIYSIAGLIYIIKEKNKAKEKFKELPEDLQLNFKNHTDAIMKVKNYMKPFKKSANKGTFNFY